MINVVWPGPSYEHDLNDMEDETDASTNCILASVNQSVNMNCIFKKCQ